MLLNDVILLPKIIEACDMTYVNDRDNEIR